MATNCLIFGTGRSGTTALVGSLGRSGAFMGTRLTPPINIMPDGACEDRDIQIWNDEMIHQRNQGLKPVWPDPRGMMSKLIHRPFALKDPRFSQTYEYWKPLLPSNHVCLITFRDPVSFVKSARRLAVEVTEIKATEDELLQSWGWAYEDIFKMDDGYFRYIHYSSIMDESIYPYLEKLLGYPIKRGFVRRELLHPQEHPCPEQHRKIYDRLLERMVRPAGIPPAPGSFEDCGSNS